MNIDISGRKWRGFATGLNEFAGYSGVAFGGIVTGFLAEAFGLRPMPFYLGLGVILFALLISIFLVKETLPYALKEADERQEGEGSPLLCNEECSLREIIKLVSWRDKTMFACSQAGAIEKFVDVMVWGFLPIYFYNTGLSIAQIGIIVGAYGFSWGILQIFTGALSDKIGRRAPIFAGMWLAGAGILATFYFKEYYLWIITSAITGVGMALLYPTLLAAVGDASQPNWRGTSLGVYRMWRDSGYGFGALLIGFIADIISIRNVFYFVALTMFLSSILIAIYLK
jgi:MFS family permease